METPKYPGLWRPGTQPTRLGATQTQDRETSAGGIGEDGHGEGPPFHALSHVPRQKMENGKSSTARPARTSTLTTPLRAASTRTSPSTSSSSANRSSMSSILSHPASSLPSWPSLSSTCLPTVSEPHGTHTRHRGHPMGHLHIAHLHQVLGHGDTPMPSTGTSSYWDTSMQDTIVPARHPGRGHTWAQDSPCGTWCTPIIENPIWVTVWWDTRRAIPALGGGPGDGFALSSPAFQVVRR